MADTASSTGADTMAEETPNQRQARLRREKRLKKMAEEGEDRLARIKALNGGLAPPEEVLGGPQAHTVADDPEEVDISRSSTPLGPTNGAARTPNTSNDPLQAALLQMQAAQVKSQAQQGLDGNGEDDPTVRMMQQMMGLLGGGGMGGATGQDPNAPPPELPPMLKAMLGATTTQTPPEAAPPASRSAYLWRIVHSVFAISLAIYVALTSTFNGSKLARSEYTYAQDGRYPRGQQLFLLFCTAEMVLQSSRYFLEKGQLQGNGILAKIANSGFVPEPWAGYVRSIGRYISFVQTIVADVMVIVFVFGALAWWHGMAAA